ncbi:unnamed protein product [Calypogeia fissa]
MVPEGKEPIPVDQNGNNRGTTEVRGELPPAGESVPAGENRSTRVTPPWALEEDGILDLTSAQLHDLKDVELSPSLIELDLTANRLTKVDERIGQMTLLKKLSLRQNLFQDAAVETLRRWPALFGLQELVLRDNNLTKVPILEVFACLTVLDISFNKISSMKGISQVTDKLKELYLSNNDMVEITEVDHLKELQILELGANRIRELNGIQNLTQLKELWLGRNRIKTVDMCGLKSLTRISVQNNRLTSMLGFQECVLLEELYLSNNFISVMEGLSTLTKLRILDVSTNKLETIQDIGNLNKLEDLWLNDNNISSLDELETALQGVKGSLTTIYLMRNPCARNLEYVRILRAMMPTLIQIDSQFFD